MTRRFDSGVGRVRRRVLRLCRSALAGSLVACAGDAATPGTTAPTPVPPAPVPVETTPSLRVLAGADAADTALALLRQALVVEVRPATDGAGRRVEVRFASLDEDARRSVYVCRVSTPACGPSVDPAIVGAFGTLAVDTADAEGRARALVRLGTEARVGRLLVTVPALGLRDTVEYRVLPGPAVGVGMSPRDTALAVGASLQWTALVMDRHGNARPDPVAFATGSAAIVVDAQGRATGREVGVGWLFARSGRLVDSARVAVVPVGRLAFWVPGPVPGAPINDPTSGSVWTSGFDGSDLRRVASGTDRDLGAYPTWSPSGALLAYHDAARRVSVVDVATGSATVLPTPAPMDVALFPRFSTDGRAVSYLVRSGSTWAVWRAGVDGSGLQRLGVVPDAMLPYYGADVSPDGTRLAYVGDDVRLRLLDLGTGRVTVVNGRLSSPRWSPAGDRLAVLSQPSGSPPGSGGALGVLRGDGTGLQIVVDDGSINAGIGWSADGQWLIVRSAALQAMVLASVAAGDRLLLRLPFTPWQPALR